MAIYRATVEILGKTYEYAVNSDESSAYQDIRNAAVADSCFNPSMIKIAMFQKSNSRILGKMQPIKRCWIKDNEYWGWAKRA